MKDRDYQQRRECDHHNFKDMCKFSGNISVEGKRKVTTIIKIEKFFIHTASITRWRSFDLKPMNLTSQLPIVTGTKRAKTKYLFCPFQNH